MEFNGQYDDLVISKQVTDEGTEFLIIKNNKLFKKFYKNDGDLRVLLVDIMDFLS